MMKIGLPGEVAEGSTRHDGGVFPDAAGKIPVKYEEMVVGTVQGEPFSAEFPVEQGKYREFSRFRALYDAKAPENALFSRGIHGDNAPCA